MNRMDISDMLYRLGLTANYIGFSYLASAVLMVSQDSSRLLLITKRLYPEVAKEYGTNWKAVERGIRSATTRIWEIQAPMLYSVMAGQLKAKPTTACFIARLSQFYLSQ